MNRILLVAVVVIPLAAFPFARRMKFTVGDAIRQIEILELKKKELVAARKPAPKKHSAGNPNKAVREIVSILDSYGLSPAGYRTSEKNGGSFEIDFVCTAGTFQRILHSLDLGESNFVRKNFSVSRENDGFRVAVKYSFAEDDFSLVDLHKESDCIFRVMERHSKNVHFSTSKTGIKKSPVPEEKFHELYFLGSSEENVFLKDDNGFYSVARRGIVTDRGFDTVLVDGRKCRIIYQEDL